MARPTKIVLRKLSKKEKEFLKQKLKDKTVSARVYERFRVSDIAQRGLTVSQIAERSRMHFTGIYDWIERFNQRGFAGFYDPPNPESRPSQLTSKQIREMIKIALSRPTDLGLPYTQWSVSKLRTYLLSKGLFPDVSNEWIRRLLKREGVTLQHTKTWKESPDIDFEKKTRILKLYIKCPSNSHVVCFDEFGPMELRPVPGVCWARKGHTQRLRATYSRKAGTEQVLAFYDVHDDVLTGTICKFQ